MMLLLLALPAFAQEAPDWHLWSWSGVEAGPDDLATRRLRAEEQVGLRVAHHSFELDAIGALRDPWVGGADGQLQRLHLGYHGIGGLEAVLGRQVRVSPLGLQHLDGLTVEGDLNPNLDLAGWTGRLWLPDTWTSGDTWVLGTELKSATKGSGREGGLGYEARFAKGEIAHLFHGSAAVHGATGARSALQLETEPGEGPISASSHASLLGATPVGKSIDLGLQLRWEGLEPESQPIALASPMDWLSDEDYGAADFDAVIWTGPLTWTFKGGPTLRPDQEDGLDGSGRGGVALALTDALSLGVAASGASARESWVAGGLVEATWKANDLRVNASIGDFRFQPLAGPLAWVWEGRLRAEGRLPVEATGLLQGLSLSAEVAGGADRVLAPWLRGGISLRADLGRTPEALW